MLSQGSRVRILIVALNYAPEIIGCGKYTSELAEELASRGHIVEVVTAPPYYPEWKVATGYSGGRWSHEQRAGVVVHRTPLYVPPQPGGVKRILHLSSFGAAALPTAVRAARRLRPDVVFAVAPTLAASAAALAAARAGGAASWLHVQDFEVDAAFELGLLKNQSVRKMASKMEGALLRAFDTVSSIAPAMVRLLAEKGVDPPRQFELRNWVDIDATPALPSSDTRYRRELGLAPGRLVALYSGNMAAKQGLEALAEVASRLNDSDAPVTLLLCGAGAARAALERACRGMGNVRFLDLQPLDRLPELLGTADMHLLPQRAEAADLVLPSKLTGMLASGRPIVAMARQGTGLAEEVEGCGLAVEPDAAAMADAVLALARDPESREALGRSGRQRAKERWSKRAIIDRFEAKLATVLPAR